MAGKDGRNCRKLIDFCQKICYNERKTVFSAICLPMNHNPDIPKKSAHTPKKQAETLETERKAVLAKIWKTLDDAPQKVGQTETKTSLHSERQSSKTLPQELKSTAAPKPKINFKAYDRSAHLDRLYKDLADTNVADYLQQVRDQLRQKNIGAHYLHLLEQEDNNFFA